MGIVNIGIVPNGRFDRNAIVRHDHLLSELGEIPETRTRFRLEEQLYDAAETFGTVWDSTVSVEDRLTSTLNLIKTSMAREKLYEHSGHIESSVSILRCMPIAQQTLDAFVSRNGLSDDWRAQRIFSTANRKTLKLLSMITLSSLEPWGPYSSYAFAAGVGDGRIALNLANVPTVAKRLPSAT